ncbi:MAG: restriction endonuclease subunit S, partial [Campylobacter sp.]|uniref:restriction endonuclease subunit S n=1 Tax=Campylobacter sp. TaxID=205 RepID=UPI0029750ED7
MNTKHLKARILDLALQGKLVENSRIPTDLNSRIPSDFNPPFKIPNSWQWVNFKDIFQILNIKSSLQQKSINKTGKFPVITQSNNFIEGYFDDEKLLINLEQNDLIVFGDHTKNVKFVNIPFIVGADGVKLIKPKPNINSKFAYHLLCFASYNTINRGYSRHFQFIKNFIYPLPPKDEQEKIVKKIDELFSQIDILDKHKESLLK